MVLTRNEYNLVISLGLTCQTANQLRRLGVRTCAGPFDWFITPFESIASVLNNNFSELMKKESLEIIGTFHNELAVQGTMYWVVQDTVSGIQSYHDFPMTDDGNISQQSYQEFKEKLDRRVDRFLTQLATLDSILFIIHNGPASIENYHPLTMALEKLRGGRYFHVLACGVSSVKNEQVEDFPVSYHRFTKVNLSAPEGERWKGCDANWDCLMKDIELFR